MTLALILAQNEPLNASGWLVLIMCVGTVCALVAFCFYRILREPKPSEHHHAPLDINTRDTE